jgi:carboxyl-terminal processing protease
MNQMNNHTPRAFQPLWVAVLLIAGIFIGKYAVTDIHPTHESSVANRVAEILHYIEKDYVDTVDTEYLVEQGIQQMLEKLDPHTVFIPPKEISMAHAQLEGNFEGVGIEFYIYKDSIVVASPIADGPSAKAGIEAGDKIVMVDSVMMAGVGITSNDVFKKLRGPQGSPVKVSVKRPEQKQLLFFTIIRGKIPTSSLDAAYMEQDSVGYIKISRFSETTFNDFHSQLIKLKDEGMKNLILDLRDNPGGYLDMATKMADQFLPEGNLIVYTQGKNSKANIKQYASSIGDFEVGNLVVLINQGSASASEIVAGAIQDNDRGLVVGSRSFGKGLVQRPIELSNGAELRLTTSRYYTPSGRCIQKPYDSEHPEEYGMELSKRYQHGEYFNADSIQFADSLKFKTKKGRTVYGGGGIMPDFFVPHDTSEYTTYALNLLNDNFMRTYLLEYYATHKLLLQKLNLEKLANGNSLTEKITQDLLKKADKNGIAFRNKDYQKSKRLIHASVRAYLAKYIFGASAYYQVLNKTDKTFQKAISTLHSDRAKNIQ